MMKKIVWITAFCSFLLFLFAGYYITLYLEEKHHAEAPVHAEKTMFATQVIGKNTKLIYRYFYTQDNVTKETAEPAPEYLYGLDMEQMRSICSDWDIIRFSSEKVIMRKVIEGSSKEAYIIGEKDGYLAVYFEDAEKGFRLKEKTEIPLYVLPAEEERKIKIGIHVNGDEELARILSDYNS